MSRYTIDGRPVPSVTEIIRDVLGGWFPCDAWYLERGTAVHGCMALVAQGKEFECDERIAGYVAAGRKWFADMRPEVIGVEQRVESRLYQYAGRYDLLAVIGGHRVLADWKSGGMDAEMIALQLGGYSAAMQSDPNQPRWGMGVELHDDGTYKATALLDLKRSRGEFLALRTVYGIRQRMGMKPKEKFDG